MTDLAHPGSPQARVGAGLLDVRMLVTQLPAACAKLDPRLMARNPVMFVVEVGAALTTALAIAHPSVFAWLIVVWLWVTVVFANLAEAVAEGRGKAQAATLRRSRQETTARLLVDGVEHPTPAAALKVDDLVVCEAGDLIPERRRRRRGHRERRRVRDHRRVRPGHPRGRRRPLRGHRRHPGALGPDRRADHRAAPARRSWTG